MIPADAKAERQHFGPSNSRGLVLVTGTTSLVFLCYSDFLVGMSEMWLLVPSLAALAFASRLARVRPPRLLISWALWTTMASILAGMPPGTRFLLPLLVGVIVLGLIVASFAFGVIERGMLLALTLLVSLSAIAAFMDVSWARDRGSQYGGSWQGVFSQKNGLGLTAALLIVLALGMRARVSKTWVVFAVGVGSLALIGSRSASAVGSLILVAVFALCIVIVERARRGKLSSRSVLLLGALLIGTALAGASTGASLLGRDDTYTGRTAIWSSVGPDVRGHSALGYGYGAYWLSSDALRATYQIRRTVHFQPGQAHNGLLDALLDGGVVGACLLFLAVAAAFRRSWRFRIRGVQWPLYVLLLGLFQTAAERGLYSAQYVFIIVIVSACAMPVVPRTG